MSKVGQKFGKWMITCLLGIGFSSIASAHEVNLLGGLSISNASIKANDVSISTSSKNEFTLGVSGYFNLSNPGLGFETGLFYVPQGVTQSIKVLGSTIDSALTVNYLHIPLMLRYEVIPHLRLGAGLYLGIPVGKVELSTTIAGTKSTQSSSLSEAKVSSADLGILMSAQGQYPIAPKMNLIGDVRLSLGLVNQSTADKSSVKLYNLNLLVGASYEL